jgi:hypothetical protein
MEPPSHVAGVNRCGLKTRDPNQQLWDARDTLLAFVCRRA